MRLVVHPQRSGVHVGIVLVSALASIAGTVVIASRPFHALMLFQVLPLVLAAVFGFALLRRVELEIIEGELRLHWTSWPYRPEHRSLRIADLRDIAIEESDDAYRVVFLFANERVPLTRSYTGQDFAPLVARLKQFAGVETEAGPPLR